MYIISIVSFYLVSTVDNALASQLVKLEDKYPVIGEQPGEVSTL